MKKIIFLVLAFLSSHLCASIMPALSLAGDEGGKLDGSTWYSKSMKGKVNVLFYVDPDEKDLNNEASEALKVANFPLDKYASVAIINMDATWLPNFAIASALKEKQEKYPDTTYVKDLDKVLVKEWKLKDDSSNVLVFDKTGKLIFKVMGKLTKEQITQMVTLIKKELAI